MSSLPSSAVTVPELADLAVAVLDHRRIDARGRARLPTGGRRAATGGPAPRRVRELVLAATTCGVGTHPAPKPAASGASASPWRYYSPDYFKRTAADGLRRRGRPRHRHPGTAVLIPGPSPPAAPLRVFLQLAGGTGWSSLQLPARHRATHTGPDWRRRPTGAGRRRPASRRCHPTRPADGVERIRPPAATGRTGTHGRR